MSLNYEQRHIEHIESHSERIILNNIEYVVSDRRPNTSAISWSSRFDVQKSLSIIESTFGDIDDNQPNIVLGRWVRPGRSTLPFQKTKQSLESIRGIVHDTPDDIGTMRLHFNGATVTWSEGTLYHEDLTVNEQERFSQLKLVTGRHLGQAAIHKLLLDTASPYIVSELGQVMATMATLSIDHNNNL